MPFPHKTEDSRPNYVYLNIPDQEQRFGNTPCSLYLVPGAVFEVLYVRVCDTWCIINYCIGTNDFLHHRYLVVDTWCIIKANDGGIDLLVGGTCQLAPQHRNDRSSSVRCTYMSS